LERFGSFTAVLQFLFNFRSLQTLGNLILGEPLASASVVKIPPSLRRDSVHMRHNQDGRRNDYRFDGPGLGKPPQVTAPIVKPAAANMAKL
jgi:hypothetical protein